MIRDSRKDYSTQSSASTGVQLESCALWWNTGYSKTEVSALAPLLTLRSEEAKYKTLQKGTMPATQPVRKKSLTVFLRNDGSSSQLGP